MRIAVIGAGKMGLPLACQMARRGGEVVACDINSRLVDTINSGRMPFDEPGIGEILEEAVAKGTLRASTNLPESISWADVIITIIPVLLTERREADLAAIENVTRTIAAHLRPGQMISYESTLPAGATRLRLLPILESSGYRAGVDFDLVFSPERVKSRLVLKHLSQIPKIVGGVTSASAKRGEEFYHAYLGAPVMNVETLEAAEFAKLAGMIYRDVNIALANELAAYAEETGLNFSSIVAAANTDGESALLTPGIGVGGHCTPVYPYFFLRDAHARGIPAAITENARRVNDSQAGRQLDRVANLCDSLAGQELLILGLGFRPGVKEHTLSPAFLIRDEARTRGAIPFLHDPLYGPEEIRAHDFTPRDLNGDLPPIVVLNTAHPEYAHIDFVQWREQGVRTIVDGRNFWNPTEAHQAGLRYIAPGFASPLGQGAAISEGTGAVA
jgi:nucleotide sugar dehydrogenase